ncbi:MAG TPA: TetR/AcrR family transcriptional regulator [Amycolatopsis sp.]|nr:TetR/AcrR family transcriptional regulator [Amycolatopsis sp.]
MARLTRAQTQQLNRAKVLAAARAEFAERGYRDAKIDAIAERADLTRGAVYSNFPGKRALHFAVLAEDAANAPAAPHSTPGETPREALGALARAWVTRPAYSLAPELLADEQLRLAHTQLLKLSALLLARALERLQPRDTPAAAPAPRLVRLAETVLTTLHGARELAATAPGFVEPFDVVSACEQLAGLSLNDYFAPGKGTATPADGAWAPPAASDLVTGEPVVLTDDGAVVVAGLHRLARVEGAARCAPVTAVLVTSAPSELCPLARLVLADLAGCVREAFPRRAWPDLRVVCDDDGAIAAAAGLPAVTDDTEATLLVSAGRIVARAEMITSWEGMRELFTRS